MDKIQVIQQYLKQENLDGFLITSDWNRRYVSGFTGTSGMALITKEEAFFITDFRYTEQASAQCKGYQVIQQERSGFAEVAKLAKQNKWEKLAFEKDYVTVSRLEVMQQTIPVKFFGMADLIEQMRLKKDVSEIQIMKEAAHIADQAFSYVLENIQVGMTELEVSHMLDFHMRKLGATGTSFDTIVASGVRSSLPHGIASEKRIEQGDFITLDFGAYYKGYCSDITRTFAIGEPNPKLVEIYEIVLEAQKRGVACLKPGMKAKDVDAVTRSYITEQGYGEYFGHSTGHGVGLEIHERPTVSYTSEQVLEPGMMITIEPGIYIAGLGGVRIEDDVLITENGYEVLTKSKKDLIIL